MTSTWRRPVEDSRIEFEVPFHETGASMIESGCRYNARRPHGGRVRVAAWFRDVRHRVHTPATILERVVADRQPLAGYRSNAR